MGVLTFGLLLSFGGVGVVVADGPAYHPVVNVAVVSGVPGECDRVAGLFGSRQIARSSRWVDLCVSGCAVAGHRAAYELGAGRIALAVLDLHRVGVGRAVRAVDLPCGGSQREGVAGAVDGDDTEVIDPDGRCVGRWWVS